MKVFTSIALTLLALIPTMSFASVSLGDIKVIDTTKVKSIYTGVGPTYVTFDTQSMVGCNGNSSGYLQPSWASAMSTLETNDAEANRMISSLLAAKATGSNVQVNYRINSNGSGWDKCAISGITYK